jgi:putative ABC transport system substrate-binding protein
MMEIRRREFITLPGGAATMWPLAAHGQRAKVPRLGVLLFSTPETDPQMEPVHSGLRELNYAEGRNLVVFYRYAEGKSERLADLAASPRARKAGFAPRVRRRWCRV